MLSKFRAFCRKKDVVISLRRYGIDALGAMAQGLFCSLLIGTILDTMGSQLGIPMLEEIGSFASAMSGAAMAIAIGYALKAPPLVLFSLAAVGYASNQAGGAGGPLSVLIIAILSARGGQAGEQGDQGGSPGDASGDHPPGLRAVHVVGACHRPGSQIRRYSHQHGHGAQPFWMGMVVSVLVGIALTLPISSAAICHAITIAGLAGGAAVAGCCAQMVGFAVMSFRENRWGGLVSQGIGTSMLQMGNIVKNPRIWIPPILTAPSQAPWPHACSIWR